MHPVNEYWFHKEGVTYTIFNAILRVERTAKCIIFSVFLIQELYHYGFIFYTVSLSAKYQ